MISRIEEPRVSIIIPVYNGSDYLAEAINSALNQTYKNIEIIVVNDGSDDDGKTETCARSFGDRIRYFSQPNGGVSKALNAGIKNMTGEYFSWLSHDDIYFPQKTEAQIEYIQNHPETLVAGSDFSMLEKNTGREFIVTHDDFRIISTGRQMLSTWVFFCSMLIHRSCFDLAGMFDEGNRTTQDTDMQLRLLQYAPIHVLDKVLAQHRRHDDQASVKNRKQHRHDQDELMKTIIDRFGVQMFSSQAHPDRIESYRTYIWLGDYALRKGAYRGAEYCYSKALGKKPFSPLLAFQLIIGLKNWQRIKGIKNDFDHRT